MSGSSQIVGPRRPGVWVRGGAAALLTLLLPGGVAFAVDDPRSVSLSHLRPAAVGTTLEARRIDLGRFASPLVSPRTPGVRNNRFFHGHFLPKVSSQLERVAPIPRSMASDRAFADSVLFDEFSESARRRATSGTRKALRNYLLETTTLGRTVESLEIGRKPGRGERDGVRFGVGISHGDPRVDMRYRTGAGAMRLRLGLQGSVSLHFSHSHDSLAQISVGYDAEDHEYDLFCRLSF